MIQYVIGLKFNRTFMLISIKIKMIILILEL